MTAVEKKSVCEGLDDELLMKKVIVGNIPINECKKKSSIKSSSETDSITTNNSSSTISSRTATTASWTTAQTLIGIWGKSDLESEENNKEDDSTWSFSTEGENAVRILHGSLKSNETFKTNISKEMKKRKGEEIQSSNHSEIDSEISPLSNSSNTDYGFEESEEEKGNIEKLITTNESPFVCKTPVVSNASNPSSQCYELNTPPTSIRDDNHLLKENTNFSTFSTSHPRLESSPPSPPTQLEKEEKFSQRLRTSLYVVTNESKQIQQEEQNYRRAIPLPRPGQQLRRLLSSPANSVNRRRVQIQESVNQTSQFLKKKSQEAHAAYLLHRQRRQKRQKARSEARMRRRELARKRREEIAKWVIIPSNHPCKVLWDICTIIITFISAHYTHSSIRNRGTYDFTSFFIFTEIWFVLDILLNFVTDHRSDDGKTVHRFGRAVWARYLTTWFAVDALSLFPWERLYITPLIVKQNQRNIFTKSFFRTKAVVKVSRIIRGRHFRLFGRVAKQTSQIGVGGQRLLRLTIKYVPKYLMFYRNMRAILFLKTLRQVHFFRKVFKASRFGKWRGSEDDDDDFDDDIMTDDKESSEWTMVGAPSFDSDNLSIDSKSSSISHNAYEQDSRVFLTNLVTPILENIPQEVETTVIQSFKDDKSEVSNRSTFSNF